MNTFHKLALVSAIALGVTAFSGTSVAGTASGNLGVSATVSNNCVVGAGNTLAFGAYDPVFTNASADLDAAGTISVTCTSGAAVTITLGQGANAGGGSTDAAPVRRMGDGGTNFLDYQLFSDSGRTAVWENVTGIDASGTGAAVLLNVYGRVAGGQAVPAGSYADTVVATVTF